MEGSQTRAQCDGGASRGEKNDRASFSSRPLIVERGGWVEGGEVGRKAKKEGIQHERKGTRKLYVHTQKYIKFT